MNALVPFSMVTPDTWPAPFLRFIEHRTPPNDPLAASRAASWRPATFKQYVITVSYFLGWLYWNGRYRDDLEVVEYVTVDTVRAYVEDIARVWTGPANDRQPDRRTPRRRQRACARSGHSLVDGWH